MLKFPPDLSVHKGSLSSLLYVVGGLLMTATAGSHCLNVAVWSALDPAHLRHLSDALTGLVGVRYRIHAVKKRQAAPVAKHQLKRLYFTDSFNNILDLSRTTLRGTHPLKTSYWFPVTSQKQRNLESTSSNNRIATRRCRIYYILFGASSQAVLMLCLGTSSFELEACKPLNQLQWLISFSSAVQARGDLIFLLRRRQTEHFHARCESNDASGEPSSLTLGLSALAVALLWLLMPYAAVCAAICLGLKKIR